MSQAPPLCVLLSLATASLSTAYSFASVRAPSPGADSAAGAAQALGRRRESERLPVPRAFFEREQLESEPEPELEREDGDGGELGQTRRTATRAYDAAEEYDGYYAPLSYSPERLRGSDLNELLYPNYMDRAKFNVSPMQVGTAPPPLHAQKATRRSACTRAAHSPADRFSPSMSTRRTARSSSSTPCCRACTS